MDKIYSRKRFIIKPIGRFCGKNANLKNIKFAKKIIKFISIILIGVYGFKIGFDYLEPVYEAMCNEKVKYTATIITNQQSTIVMNQYKYEELYTIEKDSNGNVSAIKSNVAVVNNIISDLTEKIQQEFEKIPTEKIYITLGNLTGNYLLSGFGPRIPIKISMTGSVDTEIKSEFISQGINQTLHRVYVNFNCDMAVVTPMKRYNQNVVNQFIKEGKFEEHNGILRIARKKSMSKEDRSTVIRSFAEREFRERVHYDVPPLNSENDYIESDSKLVNDLRKRYGIKNVNEDRTR